MQTPELNNLSPLTLTEPAPADANPAVDELIAALKNPNDAVRGPAWQNAGKLGAPAVAPLADVMASADFETARAAKRALWRIVYYAGRPEAAQEAQAVAAQLAARLTPAPAPVRRELLWMLSEIGGEEAVAPMAAWLADGEVREDARCALQRMPSAKALAALQQGFDAAPEEFKYNLAESLRARGQTVTGYASRKLVPTKPTGIKPVSPK